MDSPFTFNFDDAVIAARKDYPKETKGVFFINLSSPDAKEKLKAWFESLAPHERAIFKKHDVTVNESMLTSGSFASLRLLCLSTPLRSIDGKSESMTLDKGMALAFEHELGHIVFNHIDIHPEMDIRPNSVITNEHEAQADCFAVLRGLKKGWLLRNDIGIVSQMRKENMCSGDYMHITQGALDILQFNVKYKYLFLKQWSPQKTKHRAEKLGKRLSAPEKTIISSFDAMLKKVERAKEEFVNSKEKLRVQFSKAPDEENPHSEMMPSSSCLRLRDTFQIRATKIKRRQQSLIMENRLDVLVKTAAQIQQFKRTLHIK